MNELDDQVMVREISYSSDDYRKELELRDEVLRKPLGMSLYNDNLEGDKNDTHIGAFLGERLVGGAYPHPAKRYGCKDASGGSG